MGDAWDELWPIERWFATVRHEVYRHNFPQYTAEDRARRSVVESSFGIFVLSAPVLMLVIIVEAFVTARNDLALANDRTVLTVVYLAVGTATLTLSLWRAWRRRKILRQSWWSNRST